MSLLITFCNLRRLARKRECYVWIVAFPARNLASSRCHRTMGWVKYSEDPSRGSSRTALLIDNRECV